MKFIDDTKPIFLQIAERIEDDIIHDILTEESQVPSTNQFAAFFKINPATAAKGVNLLVEEGILFKRRGIGMFVATGAKEQLIQKRKGHFYEQFILPMIKEAEKLEISKQDLIQMIGKEEGQS